ncbi:MAG: flagellar motor switch protein FliG [Gammaproteobacteria bacterium]
MSEHPEMSKPLNAETSPSQFRRFMVAAGLVLALVLAGAAVIWSQTGPFPPWPGVVGGSGRIEPAGIQIPDEPGAGVHPDAAGNRKSLENDIARSIQSLEHIRMARVLLALPDRTQAGKEAYRPSASVVVDVERALSRGQIKGIVRLVAASVPNLEADRITLADQKGRLLYFIDPAPVSDGYGQRLAYKKNFEELLAERIFDILSPVVGMESLQVEVSADFDFTEDPGVPDSAGNVPKSDADGSRSLFTAGPPPPQTQAGLNRQEKKVAAGDRPGYGSPAAPGLRRLSAAVVIDDKRMVQPDGGLARKSYDKNEMDDLRRLVQQAMGYDSERGDQLTVANTAFQIPVEGNSSASNPPFWQQTWFYWPAKQLTAGMALLLLFFGIIRPLMRHRGYHPGKEQAAASQRGAATGEVRPGSHESPEVYHRHSGPSPSAVDLPDDVSSILQLDFPKDPRTQVEYIKKIAEADPYLAAEVIRGWMKGIDKEHNQSGRAALVMLALGMDRAAKVIGHLSPREIQNLGASMAGAEDMSIGALESALEKFIAAVRKRGAFAVDKSSYIRRMLTTALGEVKAKNLLERILPDDLTRGVEQLKWMDSPSIAELIKMEHPQIIAILLSILECELAADVMMHLPESVRSDVLIRIATLKGVQPDALRELDQIIARQIPLAAIGNSAPIGGIDFAAHMLNHVNNKTCTTILERIADQDGELARTIQDKMYVFDDLIHLDGKGMQTLLREISTSQLLLALKNAGEGLKEKIFKNMSRRAAEMMREDLSLLPEAKPAEIELARKDILDTVKKLAEAGELKLYADED